MMMMMLLIIMMMMVTEVGSPVGQASPVAMSATAGIRFQVGPTGCRNMMMVVTMMMVTMTNLTLAMMIDLITMVMMMILMMITQDIVKASVISLHQGAKSERQVTRLSAGETSLLFR